MKRNGRKIRIGLAQMNPTVGDLAGNAARMRKTIRDAKKLGIQLLAFPELALCGYPPEDLLLKPRFLADCATALETVARAARGISVIAGAPEAPVTRGGRPFNTAFLLSRGRIASRYHKINLPNYGVFDEKRYFEQGDRAIVWDFSGIAIGPSICEDVWVGDGPVPDQTCFGGARIIINISASPYHRRKGLERERLMQRRAREYGAYLCYCNLVGGQDELVFDGSSLIASPRGTTITRARPFHEDLIAADIRLPSSGTTGRTGTGRPGPRHSVEVERFSSLPERPGRPAVRMRRAGHLKPDREVYEALVLGTRDYVNKNGFSGIVLGISGGIDSALTAAVAVDALGAGRVVGVTMPSGFTSRATLKDAKLLASNLGIRLFEIPIGKIYDEYLESLDIPCRTGTVGVTEENIQARVRGNLLMALSNRYGWLVLATGNKSEVAVGYCTLYGDMAGGFAVLKDVPKTLVYTLCRYRNREAGRKLIPASTIRRKPTAELRPGQLDEDTLPPYPVLDRIIELYVERDMALEEIVSRGIDAGTAGRMIRMIDLNEYKRRQGPPGIKITPKAFGRDRRLPITNRYRNDGTE